MLAAVGGSDGKLGVSLEDMRGGDDLVTLPGKAAGRHSPSAVDSDHRVCRQLDGVGQIVRKGGEHASAADLV